MAALEHKRPTWPALKNGLMSRCPKCGTGRLYKGFIEQVEQCGHCGEPLRRYNVGLLLPFVMIMIVTHVIVFVMLEIELSGGATPGFYISVLVPISLVVPLILMRPVKGALIGLLWARQLSDELER